VRLLIPRPRIDHGTCPGRAAASRLVCGPPRKRQCTALFGPLIGDTVSVPVALLAPIGTDYAATERGTVLTMAPIDTESPIEPLQDLLRTVPARFAGTARATYLTSRYSFVHALVGRSQDSPRMPTPGTNV
jgi:hypothetical protein